MFLFYRLSQLTNASAAGKTGLPVSGFPSGTPGMQRYFC
jgi:hypothetical protein